MAKNTKWEKLARFVDTEAHFLHAVPNPTAEQVGMITAYTRVVTAMDIFEREEKKLDKA